MSCQNRTILLAEDEESVRRFLVPVLHKNGYEVIVAENGLEALQKSKDHRGEIHLLLSNIQMPGITGIELATQVQLERPKIEVLLISGLASGMIVLDSSWQFLPKPFLPRLLLDKIYSMLNHPANVEGPNCRSEVEGD
jgi:DNA-binding NtrC family response regulator